MLIYVKLLIFQTQKAEPVTISTEFIAIEKKMMHNIGIG